MEEKNNPNKPLVEEVSVVVGRAEVEIKAKIPADTDLTIDLVSKSPGTGSKRKQVILKNFIEERSPSEVAAAEFDGGTLTCFGKRISLEVLLLCCALLIYLLVRIIGLSDFPIYFFTDEAVQTVLADDLIRDGFKGYDDIFLPTFFYNGYQYNLGTSVYLQVLPALLFDRSVFLTRFVSVLISLCGALWVGLILRDIFHSRHAWMGVLLLSLTPTWFFHSRTAFETVIATSFFVGFIYYYLKYRTHSPKYIYAAVILGALTFYSYSPARMVILMTAFLLLVVDIKYHIKHWKTVLSGLGLTLLLGLPFLRFEIQHAGENISHLRVLGSYWIKSYTVGEKLSLFFRNYLDGLNPLYWFLPNNRDLARHVMKGYGHISLFTAPFFVLGLLDAFKRIRSAEYRTLIVALLAAPSGAALVALAVTRAMSVVIPVALISALGLFVCLEWLEKRWPVIKQKVNWVLIAVFMLLSGLMLRDVLVNGPFWYSDYGLGGMQYGGKQIFAEVDAYLDENPDAQIIFSPSWANGTNVIARFFNKDPLPFAIGSINGYFDYHLPLNENMVFVMIPEEYQRTLESGKFTDIQIERTMPFPDGTPGFYFVRLRYVDDIDAILAVEQAERRILQEEILQLGNETYNVRYSFLDIGAINDIFDQDPTTLIRTMEANPLVLEIDFESPRAVSTVQVDIGGIPNTVKVVLVDDLGQEIAEKTQIVEISPDLRRLTFDFEILDPVSGVYISVLNTHDGELAHVHLWEVMIQ
jgi:4-amino-4-deoxy-L-arabinose transferase-like glycosyltransferase